MNLSERSPAANEPDDEFEALRRMFLARLPGDQQQLTVIAATLERADVEHVPVLEQLRHCAHRMRGAAAIFEFFGLASAAYKLEQAAASSASHAAESDAMTTDALRELVSLLASMKSPSMLTASQPSE